MKKGCFLVALLASLLALSGCGGEGSASGGDTSAKPSTTSGSTDIVSSVSEEEVVATTPRNLYGISDKIGMPPALPAE